MSRRIPRPRRDESGAATVLVVTLVGLLLVVGSALGVVQGMVVAHRRAQSAADLAALAGAEAVAVSGAGCPTASRFAEANGARLTACLLDGSDITVTVLVAGPHWLGHHSELVGTARAGPG